MSTLRERARFRSRAERALRAHMDATDCLEISVPSWVDNPGMEPHLRAFPARPTEAAIFAGRYLHTSPEFAIKATLAELGTDVFTLARVYRDEPASDTHHPEFTMLEWYRVGWDWRALMDETERLIRALADALDVTTPLLDGPFRQVSVRDAFDATLGVAPDAPTDALVAAAARSGVDVRPDWDWETLFTVLYAERVEPSLNDRPTFLHSFPAKAAALAQLDPDDPSVAHRFELYLPGPNNPVEVANAFGELVDPALQRARFVQDNAAREAAGNPTYPMPERLLSGLDALGPTAGIAVGWERLLGWLARVGPGWSLRVRDWLVGEPPLG